MEIERWRELASEYIEGTLPQETAAAVRAHLDAHPESREEEVQLRGLFAELRQLPEVEPPLFFADNVMARIAREQNEKRPWWASFGNLGRTAGATLALGGLAAAICLDVPRASPCGADGRPAGAHDPASRPSRPGAKPR